MTLPSAAAASDTNGNETRKGCSYRCRCHYIYCTTTILLTFIIILSSHYRIAAKASTAQVHLDFNTILSGDEGICLCESVVVGVRNRALGQAVVEKGTHLL